MQEETSGKKKEEITEKKSTQEETENRGSFLKCVAGVYLIYTACELGDSYFKKEEGSSLGFFVAGIIFGIIGLFLLYIVVRDFLRENRQKKAEAALGTKAPGAEAEALKTKAEAAETEAGASGDGTTATEIEAEAAKIETEVMETEVH